MGASTKPRTTFFIMDEVRVLPTVCEGDAEMKTAIRLFALTIATVLLLVSLNLPVSGELPGTRQEVILRVGAQDDMKSRNVLAVNDVWSKNVHFLVYSTVALFAPETEELMPYILKGIDADDDGIFEQTEYGEFSKQDGSNTSVVTAYYDFNGVYFHDGVQATADDLLFSYHLMALDPFDISLDVLKDMGGQEGSNYSTTRWLWVYPVGDIWDPAIFVGEDDGLTFALRFELQSDYNGFREHTLGEMRTLPRHLWEDTGKVCRESDDGTCLTWEEDIHRSHGFAYDPAKHNGIPAASPDAFQFSEAESCLFEDDEVLGTGPFVFSEWKPGVSVKLDMYEDFYVDAKDRNGSKYMSLPHFDGIQFRIYKTARAAVFALQAGEIDIVSWPVPPDFVPELLQNPNVGFSISAGNRLTYLGYNMLKSPFGYPGNDPTMGDHGLYLRRAIAHLIDRERIVTTLLQDYAFPGDQFIHPDDVLWYNKSVPKYNYSLAAARQILDEHYTIAGFALGYGQSGFRNLPTIGDNEVNILCTQANYDPIQAQTCSMLAADMRMVGIRAAVGHLALGDLIEHLDNRDFQMWILQLTRPYDITEFLYATFHSSRIDSGNLAGFQNDSFDSLVEEAREELDIGRRISLVKQSSGILADALPNDAIYFRANVEVYRKDRFVNWSLSRVGSIFQGSFFSLVGIHHPPPTLFSLSLSSVSAMKSRGSTTVTATIRELWGTGIEGVDVEICVGTMGMGTNLGNLTLDGEKGLCISGLTDMNGDLDVRYEAPFTVHKTISVHFTATAEVEGKGSASEVSWTTIHPEREFLSVSIRKTNGDIISPGGRIPLRIEVTDWRGLPVSGVVLVLESSPEGLVFHPSSEILLDEGTGSVSVRAPSDILGEKSEMSFSVSVTATKMGYVSGETWSEIIVLEFEPPATPPDGRNDWRLVLIGVLLAAIVILAIYRYVAQSSADQKRRHGKR